MKFSLCKRTIILFLVIILCVLVLLEVALRAIWGFGNMPLYVESDLYEYMYAPNQKMKRFGCDFYTNSYCQRSDEPDVNKKIILGLGDSVINGGNQTDNDSLATSIVSSETEYQVLNISAGSWGPDNCAAYLKEKGLFNAKAMFVLLSSHDAGDVMDFSPIVGVHPSFPNKQYLTAIQEVLQRYIIPRIKKQKQVIDPNEKVLKCIDKGGTFNEGWNQLLEISKGAQIPLFIILHAELSEVNAGDYNQNGKIIESWASNNGIKLLKDINVLSATDYRDNIHINSKGQMAIAELIGNVLVQMKI